MAEKITMADIARMAGVGKSTVSRYFNGGYVKEETKERIQSVIRAHNYEPNAFARLKAKERGVIGVVVPTLNSKVTSRVVTSIGRCLREQGFETIIKDSDHSKELEAKNLKRLMSLNVDGILLSAISRSEELEETIQASPVPVVVLAQDYEAGICVTQDDFGAGRRMGAYVGKRQPKRVGYLGVDESDPAAGLARRLGVEAGLRETANPEIIALQGDYSYESGQRMAREILEQGSVDALICATDRLAFGAYRVLGQMGLRIPQDVSVTGFGGYDESELLKPRLTTLRFDSYALGYLGAETLIRLLRGEIVAKKQVVDYIFLEGESVKL